MQNNENETNSNETTKKCTRCKEIKLLSEFYKHKGNKDGLSVQCKSCILEYTHSHKKETAARRASTYIKIPRKPPMENPYSKTKEYKTKYAREYYNKAKENGTLNNRSEYMKLYTSSPEGKIKIKEYVNNKLKTDPNFKMKKTLRKRLRDALKGEYVSHSTLYLLCCSIEEFMKYLEQQFLPEMNWDNHGKIWEIDHIIPCNNFDLTNREDQQKCFHYSNMQPLFKTTKIAESFGYIGYVGNRNKSNKIL